MQDLKRAADAADPPRHATKTEIKVVRQKWMLRKRPKKFHGGLLLITSCGHFGLFHGGNDVRHDCWFALVVGIISPFLGDVAITHHPANVAAIRMIMADHIIVAAGVSNNKSKPWVQN